MSIQDAVKSELFLFVARASMVFASMIALPAAGFISVRMLDKLDRAASQVEIMQVTIDRDLVRQLSEIHAMARDHETRIRALERPPR